MKLSEEVNSLVSILVEGLHLISKYEYADKTNPFQELQKEIRDTLEQLPPFTFKSNKNFKLFRSEVKTMTSLMSAYLERLKKMKGKMAPRGHFILKSARPVTLEDNQMHMFIAGDLTLTPQSQDDDLIKKFLKNSLILIKSLKAFCGTKFGEFFEVLEELFSVFEVELF